VTLDPTSAGFKWLAAELFDTPGVYWLEQLIGCARAEEARSDDRQSHA